MQISLRKAPEVKRNHLIEALGYMEEYLINIGLTPLQAEGEAMSGDDLYTRILVPPESKIRPKNIINETSKRKSFSKLDSLYHKKYACLPAVPKTEVLSTLTAYLISQYCKGNICRNSFLSAPVKRKGKDFWELEAVLLDTGMAEGEELLAGVLHLFSMEDMVFSVNPTWFSWASMAENIRLANHPIKWGAIGLVRDEIVGSGLNFQGGHRVVLVGIPVATIADYYGRGHIK